MSRKLYKQKGVRNASANGEKMIDQLYGEIRSNEILVIAPSHCNKFSLPSKLPKKGAGVAEIQDFLNLSETLLKRVRGGQEYLSMLEILHPPKPDEMQLLEAEQKELPTVSSWNFGNKVHKEDFERERDIQNYIQKVHVIKTLVRSLHNMKGIDLKTKMTLPPKAVKMLRKPKTTNIRRATRACVTLLNRGFPTTPNQSVTRQSFSADAKYGPLCHHNLIQSCGLSCNTLKDSLKYPTTAEYLTKIVYDEERMLPWHTEIIKEEKSTIQLLEGSRMKVDASEIVKSMRKSYLRLQSRLRKQYLHSLERMDRDLARQFKRKYYALGFYPDLNMQIAKMRRAARALLPTTRYESRPVPHPSLWYRELYKEGIDLDAINRPKVQEALDKLLPHCEMDETTIPSVLEKFCLLVLSLPILELGTAVWQSAINFMLERMFVAPEGILKEWLIYRDLPLMIDM